MEEVKRWRSDDGQLWDTELACWVHEQALLERKSWQQRSNEFLYGLRPISLWRALGSSQPKYATWQSLLEEITRESVFVTDQTGDGEILQYGRIIGLSAYWLTVRDFDADTFQPADLDYATQYGYDRFCQDLLSDLDVLRLVRNP